MNNVNTNTPTNLTRVNNTLFGNRPNNVLIEPSNVNYTEKQERLLCGKHALNHVLQEKKIEWFATGQHKYDLFIGGRDVMDTNTKVNIHNYCRWRLNKLYRRTQSRKEARAFTEDDCEDANGNYQVNVLAYLLSELLKYKVNLYWPNPTNFNEILADLEENHTLGAVINVPGHWIAISRYFNGCHKDNAGKKVFRWALLDSLKTPIYRCGDSPKDLLMPLLKSKRMLNLIVVKDQEGAYASEAARRRTFEYNDRGFSGGRKTRRNKRRSNKTRRAH